MKLLGIELRGWTLPEPLIRPWGRSTAGMEIAPDTIVGLSAVWACVRLLTSAVSRMPVDVLIDRGGVPRPYPSPRWLRQPIITNANLNRITHFGQVMSSLLFDGNAFVATPRDNSNDVTELMVLDPRRVTIKQGTEGDPIYQIRGAKQVTEVDDRLMLHLALQPFPGMERGMSPLEAARTVFGTGLATQEWQARYFTQNATPPGYIAVPQGARADPGELRKAWVSEHQGPDNWHEPGVLTAGAEWKPIGVTNEQAQFVELRKLSSTEIAQIYGVPPHMIGDVERSTSWGTGIEQQGIGFVTYTLNDYLVLIEEGYRRLVPNPESYVRFNRNALLRGDAKSRGEFYKKMFEVGAYTPNIILSKEDEPPFEGGDEHYFQSSNFTPIGKQPESEPPSNGQVPKPQAEELVG